ncbi:MAG TPA: hypothetical protein VKH41_05340 [Myxococcota bacterium]|nr:hypothetical protein [Myxococcota bacterium]
MAAPAPRVAPAAPHLERLELRVERLRLTFRFTYAFHAREVRFECDRGDGYRRVFPETFSFHADRHDPAELFLQLADLAEKPQLLSDVARRRDSELLSARLLVAAPRYLERVLHQLEADARLDPKRLEQIYADLALLSEVMARFAGGREVEDHPGLRTAQFHLRKLLFGVLDRLVQRRVDAKYLDGYINGEVELVDPVDDLSEAGFFHALDRGDPETVNRVLLRLAERAYYRWLEDVCLDESNGAFEAENSPFASREAEVRAAISRGHSAFVRRGRELAPYLRRLRNRDVLRLLEKLESWFLRQYDIHHAAAMIKHADNVARGKLDADGVLSRHNTPTYVAALALIASPFAAAAIWYRSAPRWFDALCAFEVAFASVLIAYFMLYRFLWKRDLTFFHAAVPRIMAGIIVGYLPIFFVDEVWSLSVEPWPLLLAIVIGLGFATLLYLYIEVQRRLGDSRVAFARARQIFLLGLLQAAAIGLILTGLVGHFMATRNWPGGGQNIADVPIEVLRTDVAPFLGQLPVALGIDPFYAFPSAVFLMTFMSFFIGTFLQLMWEELPITEPL